MSMKPPPLPVDPVPVYTANWCEENIYLLVKWFMEDEEVRARWSAYAIFISNPTRTVALWSQKLREGVVVWDYHVILALKERVSGDEAGRQQAKNTDTAGESKQNGGRTWVYDLDSSLEMPCSWEDYIDQTFPYMTPEAVEFGWTIPESYRSMFRIVPGEEFLDNFASDRSHMLVSEPGPPRYHSPVPSYACIRGVKAAALGISNNLMSSLVDMDMENTEIGRVYSIEQASVLLLNLSS